MGMVFMYNPSSYLIGFCSSLGAQGGDRGGDMDGFVGFTEGD